MKDFLEFLAMFGTVVCLVIMFLLCVLACTPWFWGFMIFLLWRTHG